tara:strand:- start:429 stop:1568 length:1140 start_codon:yes stop_codon:yes gene_type:complete
MVQKIPATSLDSQRPFRNMVINGDMAIAQRGTSATTVVYDTVHTVDQWKANYTQGATSVFSVEQSTDVPSGQGFKKSLLYKCTTAESSLNAAHRMFPLFRVEDNNVLDLEFGTSNAKSVTLSFWVKSNLTGTYQINLFNNPASKYISDTYVINSANTWEFKTCHFAGDQGTATTTAGNAGLQAEFCLSAGSNYTSGTAPANTTTTYPTFANANRAASHGVNMASSTSNNWYITGVQLEAGGTGTNFTDPSDFEFLPHDVQLRRCQRYFQLFNDGSYDNEGLFNGTLYTTSTLYGYIPLQTPMRAGPSLYEVTGTDYWVAYTNGSNNTFDDMGINGDASNTFICEVYVPSSGNLSLGSGGQSAFVRTHNAAARLGASAEL